MSGYPLQPKNLNYSEVLLNYNRAHFKLRDEFDRRSIKLRFMLDKNGNYPNSINLILKEIPFPFDDVTLFHYKR